MDISKLFLWKKVCIINDQQGNPLRDTEGNPVIVYMRLIGDNDSDTAKKYTLRQSKKLRNKYRSNPDVVIPDLTGMTKDEIASLQVLNEASVLYKQAERETEIPYPKETTSLYLEDQEKYAEEIENYFDKLIEAIDARASELITAQKTYYLTLTKEELMTKVDISYINKIIEDEMAKIYTDAILHFTVFEDAEYTIKVFKSIPDAQNASEVLKEQLYAAYSNLTIKDLQLKK